MHGRALNFEVSKWIEMYINIFYWNTMSNKVIAPNSYIWADDESDQFWIFI